VQRRDCDRDTVVDDHLDLIDQVLLLEPADHCCGLGSLRPARDLAERLVDATGGDRAEADRARALEELASAQRPPFVVVAHGARPYWLGGE
jgi:hypothetical protein